MEDNGNWCKEEHEGMREVIRRIPHTERDDQKQRHRCACCAYEAGIQEGLRRANEANAKA